MTVILLWLSIVSSRVHIGLWMSVFFCNKSLSFLVCFYLHQVNEVNGGDNAFVRCVCLSVCAQRPVNGS